MTSTIPQPHANDGTQLHVSFAGGGVVVSRKKVAVKHQDLQRLQNEVGVNVPLLRSLIAAHKLAAYHQHDLDLPEAIRRAAAEAVDAVERLVKLQKVYARQAAQSGSALAEKLASSKAALEEAKTVEPRLKRPNEIKERKAFLHDLTAILNKAVKGQQEYANQQMMALAEAERALEQVHHNARRQEAKAQEDQAKKRAKEARKKKQAAPLPVIVLPPLEEGHFPDADSQPLQ